MHLDLGDQVWLKMMIAKSPTIDVSNEEYFGFFVFPQRKCGPDFIKRLKDGRISWELKDWDDLYTPQYTYHREGGQHAAIALQFHRKVGFKGANGKSMDFKVSLNLLFESTFIHN